MKLMALARNFVSRSPERARTNRFRRVSSHSTVAAKFVLALVLGMFAFAALADHQQRVCNTYELFSGVLVNQYREKLVDTQMKDNGGRYEIWKSDNGSWTLLEIMPDQILACVLGTGVMDPHTPKELMQRQAFNA